jgi:hypothetical protein
MITTFSHSPAGRLVFCLSNYAYEQANLGVSIAMDNLVPEFDYDEARQLFALNPRPISKKTATNALEQLFKLGYPDLAFTLKSFLLDHRLL